jgi:hypothetical protein
MINRLSVVTAQIVDTAGNYHPLSIQQLRKDDGHSSITILAHNIVRPITELGPQSS